MKRFIGFIIIFIIILLTNACTAKLIDTKSGKPEVIIRNTTIEKVKEKIIEKFIQRGDQIEQEGPHNLVITIKKMTFAGEVIRIHYTFSFYQSGGDVWVVSDVSIPKYEGMVGTRFYKMAYEFTQDLLLSIKNDIENNQSM